MKQYMTTQTVFSTKKISGRRKQVGILGGNFNPVHIMHLIIADQVGMSLGLDQVSLMPTFESPHINKKNTLDSEHRIQMLKLAITRNPLLNIETIELDRKGKSYTFDTMKFLVENNPHTDYYFIIGGDMVNHLSTWHRINELFNLVQFVAVPRPNYFTKNKSEYPLIWIESPLIDISSTMIRKKISQGYSVNYFLPESVLKYIYKEHLYVHEK